MLAVSRRDILGGDVLVFHTQNSDLRAYILLDRQRTEWFRHELFPPSPAVPSLGSFRLCLWSCPGGVRMGIAAISPHTLLL